MNYDEITKITAERIRDYMTEASQQILAKLLRKCFITLHGECAHCGLNSSQKSIWIYIKRTGMRVRSKIEMQHGVSENDRARASAFIEIASMMFSGFALVFSFAPSMPCRTLYKCNSVIHVRNRPSRPAYAD